MITTPKTISDLDLHNVTGGLGSKGTQGGGTGLGGLWEGAKNQWTKTKDAWSSAAKMPFEGFARMISPH
jgi:hypothetical protein